MTGKEHPNQHVQDLRRTIHTLNNALTPVLANAQLVQAILGPTSDVDQEMEDVVEGAKRTKQLIHELKQIADDLVESLEHLDG